MIVYQKAGLISKKKLFSQILTETRLSVALVLFQQRTVYVTMLAEGATAAVVHDKVALDLLTHDPSLQTPESESTECSSLWWHAQWWRWLTFITKISQYCHTTLSDGSECGIMATNKNQLHNWINVKVNVVAYVYCEHAVGQFHLSCQCQSLDCRDTTNGINFFPTFSSAQLSNCYDHFHCQLIHIFESVNTRAFNR